MNVNQKLKQFKELTYEKKVEMDKNILSVLSEKGNTDAGEILSTINNMNPISNEILDSIYLDFESSIDKIKQGKINNQLYTFDKAKNYIASLRQQEEKERANENPDNLLNNL